MHLKRSYDYPEGTRERKGEAETIDGKEISLSTVSRREHNGIW